MQFKTLHPMPPHSFRETDERMHQPPVPCPPRWQENTFFVAWDLDGGHGFLVHTKRWPARGLHEAHIAVYIDGSPCSTIVHSPIGAVPGVKEELSVLSAEPEVPWARWRLQAEFNGVEGEGPFGFIAHSPRGQVPASLKVVLESDLPPADFNQALSDFATSLQADGAKTYSSPQQHYEQAGRWSGTLTIGSKRIHTRGLYIRDHTWGERIEENFEGGVFWTASSLDEGRIFCNALGAPRSTGTSGVGVIVTEQGAYYTREVTGEFSPAPGLCTYNQSRITLGVDEEVVMTGRTKLHVPKYLPGSGANRYDNNAISYVAIGDKVGMGCIEWASVLRPEQSKILDELIAEK